MNSKLIIAIFLQLQMKAQEYKQYMPVLDSVPVVKKQSIAPLAIGYTCLAISGTMDGLRESMKFYSYNMPYNWNPANTWKNKYKNNDPSQGEKFTGSLFSDAYHTAGSMRTSSGLTYTGCLIYHFNNQHLKGKKLLTNICVQLLASFVVYNGGKTVIMRYYRNK